MKAVYRLFAVTALFIILSGVGWAQPYDVTFVNQSGGEIFEFYASSVDSEYWEDDLLEGRTLGQGEEFVVTFMDPDPVYDIRLVFPRDEWKEYSGINIRDNRRVILHQ